MSEQPEALRIAEWFEGGYGGCEYEAAAELRRLHKVNQELLEALKMGLEIGDGMPRGFLGEFYKKARAAIAKGEQA